MPLDNHRRRLRLENSSGGKSHPRGVMVRLPLPAGRRALERRTDAQTRPADSNEPLTPIEYIVAFLLFLSTLTGPALVWTLLTFEAGCSTTAGLTDTPTWVSVHLTS